MLRNQINTQIWCLDKISGLNTNLEVSECGWQLTLEWLRSLRRKAQRKKGEQRLKKVLQTPKSNGLLQEEELRKGSEGRPESEKCQESLS